MFANTVSRLYRDVRARFVEDGLYIAGAVIAVIAVIIQLGPKVADVFQRVLDAMP